MTTRAIGAGLHAIWFAAALAWCVAAVGSPRARAAETISAGASSLTTLVGRLQHHYQRTNSFRAKFGQTVTRVGAPPRDRAGTVAYLRPGRIRFDFGDPQQETIVSDGSLLHDYDPGLNQVIETPVKSAIKTQETAALLLGAGNVERDFTATAPPRRASDGLRHVVLTPRRGGDPIELGIDPATLNIVKLKLTDALGNTTEFHFSDIHINIALDSSLFVFKTPPGADVVSAGGMK